MRDWGDPFSGTAAELAVLNVGQPGVTSLSGGCCRDGSGATCDPSTGDPSTAGGGGVWTCSSPGAAGSGTAGSAGGAGGALSPTTCSGAWGSPIGVGYAGGRVCVCIPAVGAIGPAGGSWTMAEGGPMAYCC